MTHEEIAHEAAVNTMEMIEDIDNVVAVSQAIPNLPFEELTPDIWSKLQDQQEVNLALLAALKTMLTMVHKVVDNEALMSHITTVIESP